MKIIVFIIILFVSIFMIYNLYSFDKEKIRENIAVPILKSNQNISLNYYSSKCINVVIVSPNNLVHVKIFKNYIPIYNCQSYSCKFYNEETANYNIIITNHNDNNIILNYQINSNCKSKYSTLLYISFIIISILIIVFLINFIMQISNIRFR